MRANAGAARAVEYRVVADQETQLWRGFAVQIRTDREAALAVGLWCFALGIDDFPHLHIPRDAS